MGLDFGTGSVRAGLYDTSSGALIGVEEARYGTSHPRWGWAEQAPLDWWEALGQASQAVMARHGHPRVSALCACTTSPPVVVPDGGGMPRRRALLGMDCRASHEVTLAPPPPHPVMAFSGGANAVEWLGAQADRSGGKEATAYTASQGD